MNLDTPIVFIIYKRPDLTARVFEMIRQAQPSILFVVADGPSTHEESILCSRTRLVTEEIDWECEVFRDYSESNVGCRRRISSGLNWVFKQVEEAIILEDDCLPHPSFFEYCQYLLHYYRHDERVMVVSGNNFQDGQQRTPYSYYFSKYNHCWGWATWRRAWQHYGLDADKWVDFRDYGLLSSICPDPYELRYWTSIFDALFLRGEPDSWAYPWTFACWSQNGLTALPKVNLVSNIGFGDNATHTVKQSPYANLKTEDIAFIQHPLFVTRHQEADQYTFDYHFGGKKIKESKQWKNRLRQHLKNLKKLYFSS